MGKGGGSDREIFKPVVDNIEPNIPSVDVYAFAVTNISAKDE